MSRFALRSPLGRVRGLGSARSGTGHWWWQRLTALALVPLSLWFIYSLLTVLHDGSLDSVQQFFISSINAVSMVLMLAMLFLHSKLGLQVIIEDYVHTPQLSISLLILNKFAHLILVLLSVISVMKLHFYVELQGMAQ